MNNLSPAAQAVWTAYETADCDPYLVDPQKAGIAAALCAAASQLTSAKSSDKLRAIAAELEGHA